MGTVASPAPKSAEGDTPTQFTFSITRKKLRVLQASVGMEIQEQHPELSLGFQKQLALLDL